MELYQHLETALARWTRTQHVAVCSSGTAALHLALESLNLPGERKNVDGDYTPDNCVWATAKAQARNKRNNRRETYQSRTLTFAEWSEWSGIPYTLLVARVTRLGWSFEKAITTPVRPRGKN